MPPSSKPKSEYIETDTGNKVSRRAKLHGTQHIILGGRTVIQPDVVIRGDLVRTLDPAASSTATTPATARSTTSVTIGRYTYLSNGAVLKPPSRSHAGKIQHAPLKIGDHTFIGPSATIEAATIGDHVHVGKDVVIGKMCVIKDYVKILPGSILAPAMVVPSGSVVGGQPARVLGETGDGWGMGVHSEGGDLRELWKATGQPVSGTS